MSYESQMLSNLNMPSRHDVEIALLKTLVKHNGVIKEFGEGEDIVDELAIYFGLVKKQRNTYLETIYKKENRVKKSNLWHRLLFRAADNLAKSQLVSRPTVTFQLTQKREWMLTENGYGKALKLLGIPMEQKNVLPIKSFETEKIVKRLCEKEKPELYNPFEQKRKVLITTKEAKLRNRSFMLAIVETYKHRCAVCGLKITSPNSLQWEVEAAHIVPHSHNGKDDLWNGIALCHLHHWLFDVGWFSIEDNFRIVVSDKLKQLDGVLGRMYDFDLIGHLAKDDSILLLPSNLNHQPHLSSINWHRQNIFYK